MRITDDHKIAEYFSFLLEKGFTFVRDYNKATDSSCTQIYRFAKNEYTYVEFRILTERECTFCVCIRGEKSFPNIWMRYKSFIRKWKFKRLFSKEGKDDWLCDSAILQEELRLKGSLFGIEV
jgi:hypothetical protein